LGSKVGVLLSIAANKIAAIAAAANRRGDNCICIVFYKLYLEAIILNNYKIIHIH
jgi:hypothetical protein